MGARTLDASPPASSLKDHRCPFKPHTLSAGFSPRGVLELGVDRGPIFEHETGVSLAGPIPFDVVDGALLHDRCYLARLKVPSPCVLVEADDVVRDILNLEEFYFGEDRGPMQFHRLCPGLDRYRKDRQDDDGKDCRP